MALQPAGIKTDSRAKQKENTKMNNWNAKWIKAAGGLDTCPEFVKEFDLAVLPERATLRVTATGIYEVFI